MTGETETQTKLRERFGLRLGPEMATYVLRQLEQGDVVPEIAVMGSDARTGVPMKLKLPATQVRGVLESGTTVS